MSVKIFNEAKGNLYLNTSMQIGLNIANDRYFQPFMTKAYENKDLITKVGLGALAVGAAYLTYKLFCNLGNSPLLQIKPQIALYLENQNGENERHPLTSQTIIECPLRLHELKHISIQTKSTTTVLIESIEGLKTREELISWIIKYQHLTLPESDGKDTVSGTAGSGLVLALRLALAGEYLGATNDAPKKALLETIEKLRDSDQLDLLNGSDLTSFHELQKIEMQMHENNVENYDIIGAALTHLGVNVRTAICYASVKIPSPDYAKATLGASRMLNNLVTVLNSFANMMQ